MKKRYWIIGTLLVATLLYIALSKILPVREAVRSESSQTIQMLDETQPTTTAQRIVRTTPDPKSTLNRVPNSIEIETSQPLSRNQSTLNVTVNSKNPADSDLEFSLDNLAMRQTLRADAPTGTYTVEYHACWTDGNCSNSSFQFTTN